MRTLIATLVLIVFMGCGSEKGTTTTSPFNPHNPPTPTQIQVYSDVGQTIGNGFNYEYTQATAIIHLGATGAHLTLSIQGDEDWGADIKLPTSFAQLEPGSYSAAPTPDSTNAGLVVSGDESYDCTTAPGSVTIDSLTYHDSTLTTIDFHFQQICAGSGNSRHGTIHWAAADTTRPPGPVLPVPSALWQHPSGATPDSGNYAYLQSDPGEYVGGGQTYLYSSAGSFTFTGSGPRLSFSILGGEWAGDFMTMNTISRSAPGYYQDLKRYPFNNPARGGFDWVGMGRGCLKSVSWVAIDRIRYDASGLAALDLRFGQHCSGATALLHGQIHWDR
jgi:hypothetical protein